MAFFLSPFQKRWVTSKLPVNMFVPLHQARRFYFSIILQIVPFSGDAGAMIEAVNSFFSMVR
jgi:hypothetical protein